MKKKIVLLMILICAICCAICLAACEPNEGGIIKITDIALNYTEITLHEGEHFILTETITPSNAYNQSTEWTSSNRGVAEVYYGNVTAIAEGVATITVSTSNGKTATCVVTVVANEPEPTTKYAVTFDANGGEFEDSKTTYVVDVDENQKLPNVTATRGDKYAFIGWYTDEYRNCKWDMDNDVVNDEVTLYAGWKYLNSYQSVMDALSAKIKAERQNDGDVNILLIFTQNDCLCFVEKDSTGVFSYKTDVCGFDEIIDNAELIAAIPDANLTLLDDYNGAYTSDNNETIANGMAYRYTVDTNPNDSIIYSCVSEWKIDTEHFTNNGPWYSCEVKAIIWDNNGKVYDCCFTVVAGFDNFNAVLSGQAMSEDFGLKPNELGETANDFYAEYIKEIEA